MKAVVIADDLTGAQEMGALLAARRLRTLVTTRWEAAGCDCEAVVVDTESRQLDAVEAAHRVRVAAESWIGDSSGAVFKKVDSTLRGSIVPELLALSSALGGRRVVFTPAYPLLGRVVRKGILLVHGVEVSQTGFGRDPRWPVRDSRVMIEPCATIRLEDAESEEDLQNILRQSCYNEIPAGSGGLGRAWAATIPAGEWTGRGKFPAPRRPLLISGSLHPASAVQARRALQIGIRTVMPPELAANADIILRSIAAEALHSAEELKPDLLILFGGETAEAVLARLGICDLWPERELFPGIAAARALYRGREMMIVTKAGGFGEPHIVEQILRELQ